MTRGASVSPSIKNTLYILADTDKFPRLDSKYHINVVAAWENMQRFPRPQSRVWEAASRSEGKQKGRKKEGRERKGSLRAGNPRKDTEGEGKAGVEKAGSLFLLDPSS